MNRFHVPQQKWLLGIHLMMTARKGIYSIRFAKHMGVVQKTE